MSRTRTAGELRRRIMLASGSMMRKLVLMVDSASLEGDEEPLIRFSAMGLDHDAQLTVYVSEVQDASDAQASTDDELRAFVYKVFGAGCPKLASIDLGRCRRISNEVFQALSAGCPNLQHIVLTSSQRIFGLFGM